MIVTDEAILGPAFAKIQSFPALRGSVRARWVEATKYYRLSVIIGKGHAECAVGWFYGMAFVPVAAGVLYFLGIFVHIPVHIVSLVVSLPGFVSLSGVSWSAFRQLTHGLLARWERAARPTVFDDLVALMLGSVAAYYVQTLW